MIIIIVSDDESTVFTPYAKRVYLQAVYSFQKYYDFNHPLKQQQQSKS